MHLVHRRTCRVCGSQALTRVIDLGEQYLQGSFVKPGKELPPLRKIPTVLLRCDPTQNENGCGLLQMAHSVPSSLLYATYWYRSGTNRTMCDHLAGITREVIDYIGGDSACVLDIGCNDGTLLKSYPGTCQKWGVDPSDVAQEIHGDIQVVRDTFPSRMLDRALKGQKFDVITSIAMFYDLEDPVDFVHNVAAVLKSEGLWVFEVSYMPLMLKLNSYDTICHEHLEYYHLAVLENIVKRAGMKIVRVGINDINGGSIRCYATHLDNHRFHPNALMTDLRQQEFDLELDTDKPYLAFQERIETHRAELGALLRRLKNEGKTIHIYGASTKGNTLLQWCGIDCTIVDLAAERNPDKYGAKTLGTNIPIVSEAESRTIKPDYYLVLPWHFKNEFLEREKDMLNSGVGMIFPLPKLEVIQKGAEHGHSLPVSPGNALVCGRSR